MFFNLFLILFSGISEILAIQSDNFTVLNLLELPNLGFEFYKNSSALETLTENKNLDSQCLTQLEAIEHGLMLNQFWSIKFIDSWGKIPSGILYRNLLDMGNFDECLGILHNDSIKETNIRGKYCLAKISMDQNLDTTERNGLQIGICIPAACRAEELRKPMEEVLKRLFHIYNTDVGNSRVLLQDSICSTAETKPFEVIDWIAFCILMLLAVLVVTSTMYDYLTTQYATPVHPLWSSFSVLTNMRKLFHISSYNNATHIIPCLNGLRSICMIWVVFGHTFIKMTSFPSINNIELNKWNRSVFSNFWEGYMGVDTFFFISGLLVITVAFRQMEKNEGRINIPLMYLHRILRLTPVLALAVLLHMSVNRYLGIGPIRSKMDQKCLDNWWATLLYIQNYYDGTAMCYGHSWYLAVDMQLYFISPLILLSIWKWKNGAIYALILLVLLLSVVLITVTVSEKISVLKLFALYPDYIEDYSIIYLPTHMRAVSWIIGIVFGHYLHRRGGKNQNLSKFITIAGWLCSICLIFTLLFALHPRKQLDSSPLTPLKGGIFLSLSHIAWPLAIAWIVFACVNGFGGPIGQFLSSSLWQPFSKLTYCLYIYHWEVVEINVQRIQTSLYLSDYDGILRFWGDFGVSLTISLVFYLALEAPMANIDQLLFRRKR